MQNSQDVGLARTVVTIAAVALLVIIACSAPSTRRIAQRFTPTGKERYQAIPQRFEDEDGIATAESEAAYSYQIQRMLVLLLSVIGSLDCLVLAVIATQRPYSTPGIEQWLQFGAWVCFNPVTGKFYR
jgi:hypothetical protein